jgi:hypothetical protein
MRNPEFWNEPPFPENRGEKMEFMLKIGEEEPIRIKPTRRVTVVLLTAATVLVLGAAIIEAVV